MKTILMMLMMLFTRGEMRRAEDVPRPIERLGEILQCDCHEGFNQCSRNDPANTHCKPCSIYSTRERCRASQDAGIPPS